MGKHFDGLVELVRHHISYNESSLPHLPHVRKYLAGLIENAALFDFPLNAEEIFPRTGKDHDEYTTYLADYLDMSRQYGSHLLTPFELTAVEDKASVVFLTT